MTDFRNPNEQDKQADVMPTQTAAPTPDQVSTPIHEPNDEQRHPRPVKEKRKLTKDEKRKRRRRRVLLATWIIGIVMGLAGGFFIGRAWPDRQEISFYANVREINEDNLLVEGIPENDINHRSQMYVRLAELDTPGSAQTTDGENIPIEDLEVDELVRIVYDGEVMESFPAQLPTVWRIEQTGP